MAVTGPISDLALTDLLNMVRFRGGHLTLTNTPRITEMVMYFSPGYVTGFSVDRQTVRVDTQVVDHLVAVAANPMGDFVFEPKPEASLRGSVRITVDRLALFLVQKVDEINMTREQLPPVGRLYRLRDEEAAVAETLKHLDEPDLVNFVLSTKGLLFVGVSAGRLAELHQMSAELVRHYFYKLELLGVVVPANRDSMWASLDQALRPKTSGIRLVGAPSSGGIPPSAVPAAAATPEPVARPFIEPERRLFKKKGD